MLVKFKNLELDVKEDVAHEWLLDVVLVAQCYNVSTDAIYAHLKRNSKEFHENKHFIRIRQNVGFAEKEVLFFSKRGVVRLGFFIKSDVASEFRDWAEDLIIAQKQQTSLSPLQLFEVMLQQAKEQEVKLLEQSKKLTIIEDKVNELQAHNSTHQTDYFTISGYYRYTGQKYNLSPTEGQKMGKALTSLSNVLNYTIQKVPDMKFGTVGAYNIDIFKTYFEKKQ